MFYGYQPVKKWKEAESAHGLSAAVSVVRSFMFVGMVSKCSEEIKNYIEERSGEDPLVKGVPEDKNPFKEKGGCVIA
ncbi:PREDICTED: guanine nucleotide-binding protein G(I)/G(S)/G(O) subunit gamma-11 [Charadrius vociferus]|uniref:guanine nucleotide-binding protein G(I)/G(S)/G(O) subunit gamma-11 n=1 Tax=Charadrius vociferus TaxID=50402 RepID=UPI00052167BB|nr:PREDICTED: guanine nucleotide-binding protein G(I)/G(S)/G(O) subunit gamma-11 [Charadrius vociferus]